MDLFKNNLEKINNRINELKKEKNKREKRIQTCDKIFKPLSIFHISLAAIYSLAVIIPKMFAMTNPILNYPLLLLEPASIIMISSCAISLGLTGIIKNRNENEIKNINKRIIDYKNMQEEYTEKIVKDNYKDRTKNMRSKQPQKIVQRTYNKHYEYEKTQEQPQTLKLRK